MYGLPATFDASRLQGAVLELVCFSENTVSLSFSREVAITIESCFMHSDQDGYGNGQQVDVPVSDSRLMQLLGASILSASADADGTLRLKFSNGQTLVVLDDCPTYEAYKINIGDERSSCSPLARAQLVDVWVRKRPRPADR